jgi:hypothetical protein
MDNFDYKKYLYNNPLLKEVEDNGPEEEAFDNEFDALGDQLASAIENELGDKVNKLDEAAGVVGIIGYILLSNTIANMLSKFAKKQSEKHDWGKGKAAAEKIYKWTHDNEKAFQAPIRRIVSLFTKDKKKQDQIASILYAIIILMMAGQAGGNAVGYLKKASYLKGGLYTLKTAIKGKEVHTIFKDVIGDILS